MENLETSEFAKFTEVGRIQFDFDYFRLGENAPYLLYANLDFKKPSASREARRLIRWVHGVGPDERHWSYKRVFLYLKKHQQEFRNCLSWIADGCRVDFNEGQVFFPMRDDETSYECRDRWGKYPPVKFFREHALSHATIDFDPEWQEYASLSGLKLTQKKPKDPLDAICWHLLSVLVILGTPAVRQCRYSWCQKFFQPPTKRRFFCSDSCRALQNVYVDWDDEREEEKLRERKRQYMKDYRANPLVRRRRSSSKPPANQKRRRKEDQRSS
jgi:hypothetical protein